MADNDEWEAKRTDERVRSAGKMDSPELLICEYNLLDWKNPNYTGGNPEHVCKPRLAESYAGLVRRVL